MKYADARDERMEHSKSESAAHGDLIAAMQEEGIEEYEYGDVKVKIDATRKAKVKIQSQSGGDEEKE